MSDDDRLNLVICRHMHQPRYCDLLGGSCQLPRVCPHAIKDYIDTAAHLEAAPAARGLWTLRRCRMPSCASASSRASA
jgi:hypothetical protein